MINPGERTKQITLQVKTITQDAELNPVTTWVDWKTVWAKPIPKTSREYFRLQTVNSELEEAFNINYMGNVTSRMRVKFGSKYFDIIGSPINSGERNEELILSCKGVV